MSADETPRRAKPPASRVRPAGARAISRAALLDLALMLVAFCAAGAVAGLAGAPNLGTALSFGQIGFALAAVYALLRR